MTVTSNDFNNCLAKRSRVRYRNAPFTTLFVYYDLQSLEINVANKHAIARNSVYMPISSKTLDSIQAAGAAAFAAHAELQNSVSEYSDQVKNAVMSNAFDMGNDNLFEEWKTLARLTQAVGLIEAELRKVYSAAASFSSGSTSSIPALPALLSPQLSQQPMEVVTSINATDVRVKKTSAKGFRPVKVKQKKDQPLRGNTAKLLTHLLQKLNSNEFVEVNRTALAGEIGIPIGSIGASVSKLLQTGHIVLGPKGELKLA